MRAFGGVAATILPVLIIAPPWTVTLILLLISALCGYFLYRTVERHRLAVGVDDEGIYARSFRNTDIRWTDLSRFQLHYYTLRRDRTGGWMELDLRAGDRTIKLDSRMEDFVTIVRRAHSAARANRLPMTPITQANLMALRIF
jgi:hypothetical protein